MGYRYYTLRKNSSNCFIFEFDPDSLRFDATVGQRGKLEKLSKINGEPLSTETTYAKINGGFFNMNGSTEYLGTYIDEGVQYSAPRDVYPTIIFGKDKKLTWCQHPTAAQLEEYRKNAQFALGVPWMLVIDGKANYVYTKNQLVSWFGHPTTRAPRTMVGQKKDGTVVFVVVDGRRASSLGFTIDHSSALMLELGCTIAANLDGGGSSEMIIDGKIVNKVSDGAERAIGTALVAYKTKTSTTTATPNIIPMNELGTVTASALNVRSAPEIKTGNIVGSLKRSSKVTVTGRTGSWYRINYNGSGAYVSSQYISLSSTVTYPSGITTAALNMRKGPNTTYAKILCIPKGTRLMLEASQNGWYQVTYQGKTGWCSGSYIKL